MPANVAGSLGLTPTSILVITLVNPRARGGFLRRRLRCHPAGASSRQRQNSNHCAASDGAAEDIRIAAVAALPVFVTQNGDVRQPRRSGRGLRRAGSRRRPRPRASSRPSSHRRSRRLKMESRLRYAVSGRRSRTAFVTLNIAVPRKGRRDREHRTLLQRACPVSQVLAKHLPPPKGSMVSGQW